MSEEVEEKHAGGRPLKFETPELLQAQVDKYFISTTKPTLAGLALALGIDRQTLYNYKNRDEFFDIVKKATDIVEAKYEERLIYDGQPTGVIFALKNMGWKDKTETALTDPDGKAIPPAQINVYTTPKPSEDPHEQH